MFTLALIVSDVRGIFFRGGKVTFPDFFLLAWNAFSRFNISLWKTSVGGTLPCYVTAFTLQHTVLDYSVPQGYVLGPQLFTVYTYPLRDIIKSYNLNYNVYTDDTQLYLSFISSQQHANSAIATLESYINDIH